MLLGAQPVIAGPLEDALALVMSKSAELGAKQHEAEAISQQSTWSSEVRFAYSLQQTQESASGIDAGVTVKIPLFDRSKAIKVAQARYPARRSPTVTAKRTRGGCRHDSLSWQSNRRMPVKRHEFQRDRLEYYKKAVDEGREEAAVLWQVAKSVRDARQTMLATAQTLSSELEKIARTYGGEKWMTLQDLLAEYVRQKMHSMPSAAAATSW